MHQQNQNIIHVISHDNAQSTKIERPALLSLHLKLHWNCNQQLLQGKGKQRKAEGKKKNYMEFFFCGPQKNLVPAFFWLPGQVLQRGHWSRALLNSGAFTKPLSFSSAAHGAASQEQGRIHQPGPPSSLGSTALLLSPVSASFTLRLVTRKAKTEPYTGPSGDQEGLAWEGGIKTCLGWRSLTFSPGPCSAYCPFGSLLSCSEAITRWHWFLLIAFQQDFSIDIGVSCRIFPSSLLLFFFTIQNWLKSPF